MKTWFALFAASILAVTACGARSSLPEDVPPPERDPAPLPGPDAAPVDAGPDVEVFPDAAVTTCEDAGTTYIYLISTESALVRFNPPDLSFTTIGTINCPASAGATPYSMAVDRQGIAYVVFSDSELFRVSTRTAACEPTAFGSQANGFSLGFGMGFSSNKNDPGETLFVTGNNQVLGTIDVSTFDLSIVGAYDKPIGDPDLTGTSDSRLFGFGPGVPDSHLAEIDKSNATVISDVSLQLNQASQTSWAFAFWGGDFYIFTAETPGTTQVHRYTPGGSTTPPLVASLDLTITGAGVSTCAPSD